ncbi:MAG: alpha-glucosidase [Gaiellaceae bacterium]|jgi:alpha-glucosidase|nr:alpha-glucosidase [Gaiellaceae bacterium]
MTVARVQSTAHGADLLAQPHHDGSDLCVLELPDEPGGEAVVRLRVPRAAGVESASLRYIHDGEPAEAPVTLDAETETETWLCARLPLASPSTHYRWLLAGAEGDYAWLNGLGLFRRDVADADDFVLEPGAGGPDWHLDSVVYEIFPDRFARSGTVAAEPPDWAIARQWDDLPTGRGSETPFEWFGGDLRGIEQHLDHVERLGATVIYLTPVFPAGSTHRYDATTFDRVDPLLGGDEALASLLARAHARGIRILGDLTLNHTGDGHEWFRAALADPEAPERDFYYFDGSPPAGYASWYGIPSLPKLDWRSDELRRRLLDGVARQWLAAGLDGWRIDCANVTGRYGEIDLNHDVARAMRAASVAERPDAVAVAEHGHDYRPDLGVGGWHGAMNYAGFFRPVGAWLRGELPPELQQSFWGMPVGMPRFDGAESVATMRAFRAGVPWSSTLHSWTLLDSHDTARFRTVAGSAERHLVAIGMQMTTPGVPMIFAGDELGLEGAWGEDGRRTMPWDRPETWDAQLLLEYRRLVGLRRSSEALARGGIRYAHVGPDAIAYLRETREEQLLCLAARDDHAPVRLSLAALGCEELEPLYGGTATVADGEATLPADGPAFHVWRLT